MVATGTLRYMDGIEVGGLDLARATVGSPSILGTIASPAGRSGAFALRLNPAGTQEQYDTPAQFGTGGTAEDSATALYHLWGLGVRFSDITPVTEYVFAAVLDDADNICASLVIEADGDLRLDNQPGTGLDTTTTPFTANAWHYVEFFSAISAGTNWELWLDGVSLATGTSDFLNTNAITSGIRFGGAGSGDGNVDFDDFYHVDHNLSLAGNNLGPSEVFAYQGAKIGQNADAGLTTNDSSLDTNDWADLARTPLKQDAGDIAHYIGSGVDGAVIFNDAAASGHGPGPTSGAYTIDGTIQGAMWYGIYQRGTGGGTSHVQWYGNGADTVIQSYTMDAIANSVNSPRGVVSEAVNAVPLSTESFAMGMGTTGAQDIEGYEHWAFLLHTPSSAVDDNRYGRPFGRSGAIQMQQLLAT